MKNLLYIGNNLNTNRTNLSSIQTLGGLLESEGYQLRYTSSYKFKILRLLDMLWSCIKFKNWIDIVIVDTYSTQNFYYALFCSQLCRLLQLPYCTILHGGDLPKRLKNNPKLSDVIFNNSKQNISPSLYLKNAFVAKGYKNVNYIPNTIKLKNYPIISKDYNSIRLLWVRSFSKIYNPEMAIQVLKKLIDLGYPTSLCMIGPDSDGRLKELKALAKDLNVNVEFTGKLPKSEWLIKSKESNIFINTTNFDNAPVSVIEAMALGFPIVSTNAGGMPFLLKDKKDGILVKKNDVDAMVEAIIKVYEKKSLRDNLTLNARKKAKTFDWEVVKYQWNEILK